MRVDLRYFILSFLVLVSFYFSNAQSTYGLDKRQVKVKTGMQDTSRSVVDITKGHIFKNKLIPDLNFSKPFPERSKDSAKNQGGLLNSLKVHGVTFGVSESLEGYYNLMGGIRSGMTYGGARNIKELQRKAEFVEVTQTYISESKPRHHNG